MHGDKIVWKFIKKRNFSHFVNHKIADYISRKSGDLIRKRGNKQMAIYANEYIGIQINQFGYFEDDELGTLFEYLDPLTDIFAEGTAIDIGANIGNHSLYFSSRFKNVQAFEPNPRTFSLLKFNTEFLDNVECYPIGLGDIEGTFSLRQDSMNPALASIKYNPSPHCKSIQIPVKTLDELNIGKKEGICLMKMDVEGFEENVIKGGEQTLKNNQPIVVLEQHKSEFTDEGVTPAILRLKHLRYTFCWEKKPKASRGWINRRLKEAKECLIGKRIEFVSGINVPPANYTMLVAIPERFRDKLRI